MLSRFHIDNRLITITVVMALLSLGLLATNIVSEYVSDGYSELIAEQDIWSRGQNVATGKLIVYLQTQKEAQYHAFHQDVDNLLRETEGMDLACEYASADTLNHYFDPLLGSGWNKKNMLWVYRLYYLKMPEQLAGIRIPAKEPFDKARSSREQANTLLDSLHTLAVQLHASLQKGVKPSGIRADIQQVLQLDEQITRHIRAASLNLNKGSRELHKFERTNLIFSLVLVLAIGLFLGLRFTKSIQEWRRELMQRFREVIEREKNYVDLLNSIDDGIYIKKGNGKYMEVNKAGAEMFGYTKQELIGEDATLITGNNTIHIPGLNALQKGRAQTVNFWGKHKNDTAIPIEVKYSKATYRGEEVILAVARDITDQQNRIKELEQAYNENLVLLKEVHHRVKNNMALISGLLQLQEFATEDDRLKNILSFSQNRIHTIANIHEVLYQSISFNEINFNEYLEKHLKHLYKSDPYSKEIGLSVPAEPVILNINQAIPCALLINEILNTCYPTVRNAPLPDILELGISKQENQLSINIHGQPLKANSKCALESVSQDLVQTLTQQLEARVNRNINGGVNWDISFTLKDTKGIGNSIPTRSSSHLS